MIFLFVFILTFEVSLKAVTITPQALQSQMQSTDLLAEVFVSELKYSHDTSFFINWEASVRIENILYQRKSLSIGNALGRVISVSGLGGEMGGVGVLFSGFPRLYKGRRYRLNLKKESNNFRIVGYEKGILNLDRTRSYSRNRTDGSDGSGTGPFLHWNNEVFPVPYFVSLPSFLNKQLLIPAIEASFNEWSSVENSIADYLSMGCSNSIKNENDSINQIILVERDWHFDPDVIAITRNFYTPGDKTPAGQILDTDILLNAQNHQFTTTGEIGAHDLQNILTHEVGHSLGFGHEVDPQDVEATMYSVAIPGEINKQTLSDNEKAALVAAYPGDRNKLGAQGISCNLGDGGAGCAIRKSASGGKRAFVVFLCYLIGLAYSRRVWVRDERI